MIEAYKGKVIVTDFEMGEKRHTSGIYLGNDDGKSEGIRARWAKVKSVGAGVDIPEGYWILVLHGRWTRGIKIDDEVMYMVDYPSGVIAISESTEKPDVTFIANDSSIKAYQYRPEEFSDVQREGGICY